MYTLILKGKDVCMYAHICEQEYICIQTNICTYICAHTYTCKQIDLYILYIHIHGHANNHTIRSYVNPPN